MEKKEVKEVELVVVVMENEWKRMVVAVVVDEETVQVL